MKPSFRLLMSLILIFVVNISLSAQSNLPPCDGKLDYAGDCVPATGGNDNDDDPILIEASVSSSSIWNDFFCIGNEVCAVGDFDGDGQDDIITFLKSSVSGTSEGDAIVALSNGQNFIGAGVWHSFFCIGNEVCAVGDFDGDGRDDIVTFLRSAGTGDAEGDVVVALSTGQRFMNSSIWNDFFCIGNEVCAVGDFDGDGQDDIITFLKSSVSGTGEGDVYVALSNGSSFRNSRVWHESFCYGDEICSVGDFNGDGRDDIVAFVRSNYDSSRFGQVFVALSNGEGFDEGQLWQNAFCLGEEICQVGDFNGDGQDDIVAFLRSFIEGERVGDVWIGFSDRQGFEDGIFAHDVFCVGDEICGVGDFNGDNQSDLIAFVRSTKSDSGEGDVWVHITP